MAAIVPQLKSCFGPLAASFDGVRRFALDLYEHMQNDWTATAYWAGVWACGFVVTFLLVRMLFTRWGDRNITQKTLGVSLLVHFLAGLISSSVVFESGSAGAQPDEVPGVPIQRVVVEGPSAPGDAAAGSDEDPFDRRSNRPGNSPAWEQAAQRDLRSPDRQPVRTPQAPDSEIVPEKRAATADPLVIPVPELTQRPQGPDPAPEAMREDGKIARPAAAAQPRITEETAQSRPDVSVRSGAGSRTAATATGDGPPAAETGPRTRAATTGDLKISADGPPTSSPSAGAADPQVPAGRKADARAVPRIGSSGPRSTSIGDGDAGLPAAVPGKPGRSFTRTGIPGRGEGDPAGTARSGTIAAPGAAGPGDRGAPGPGGGVGIGNPATGPRLSSGDSQVGIVAPNVMRSGGDGVIDKNSSRIPATYRWRQSPQRAKIAIDMGANEESERAVEASLLWLAANQRPQGYWEPIESVIGREPEKPNFGGDTASAREQQAERERSGFQSETGLTALAILAFLGKGYTHEDNDFADNVDRALRWLISQQDAQGFLGGKANRYARMYCHGMATIALGEAYGMTKDRTLREPLARAIQYIVAAQYPDGSWRYSDWRLLESQHRKGDMSMFGWQLMALKSAKTAGLDVPGTAFEKGVDFLIAAGNDSKTRGHSAAGGLAAYRLGEAPKPSMTAESLFCKQMLGIKRTNRASVEAVEYLLRNLPQRSRQDLYYWYYGTLAMYHHVGEPWRRWNQALRDNLVADQRTDGDYAGSWNPRFPWGDYGGRVFSTAVSTLCLEVYYRFLPLYQTEEADRLEQGIEK
ncbi:MAG: hypothetical protein HY290_15615 [Planctomycetia bacterium]|nr:hypothetical protein [Planctomycetia bacterium]